MNINPYMQVYDFTGQTYMVTGAGGVLGGAMARALFECSANVAILDINLEAAQKMTASFVPTPNSGRALAVQADVLQSESVKAAVDQTLAEFGQIDGLINAAGGNKPAATTGPDKSFFDLPADALRWVFDLNLLGTIIPSQIVGRHMAERKQGVILNISSMNSFRPLTRIPAYAAAKAGVNNFTQWLAVHMAQEYSPDIRVNAIAPGFFQTEQNRFLLTDAADRRADRPRQEDHQPHPHGTLRRAGEDLLGTVLWLLSPASAFVTGIIVPVDGGFSAYSGV